MNTLYENERLFVVPFDWSVINNGNYCKWWNDQEVTKHNSHGLFPMSDYKLQQFMKQLDEYPDSQLVWAVFAKVSPKVIVITPEGDKGDIPSKSIHIGNISLQKIDLINRSAEFACVFGEKDYWGKGYCSQAAAFLFDHGFDKLGLNRIWTGTAATNKGMMRVAEKLGMAEEGRFTEGVFLNGEFVDVIAFGVTAEMWEAAE